MPKYPAGDCNQSIEVHEGWRVLDVGSGQAPHPRADVLVERYPTDHQHRSGDAVNIADRRLVVADGAALPFDVGTFDYAVASHVAEHVEDPEAFCRELMRVARRGYIETPGWLGDMLLREEFHCWRVRRRGGGLEFQRVTHPRPLGVLADAVYAIVYADIDRDGHRTLRSRGPVTRLGLGFVRRVLARLLILPGIIDLMYTRFWWEGEFPVTVRWD